MPLFVFDFISLFFELASILAHLLQTAPKFLRTVAGLPHAQNLFLFDGILKVWLRIFN